jgi:hypothetical protein
MKLRKTVLIIGFLAIPGWYLGRTLSDGRTSRFAWNLWPRAWSPNQAGASAAEGSQPLARAELEGNIQRCIALGPEIESRFQEYVREAPKYKTFIETMLRSRVKVSADVNPQAIARVLERLRATPYSEAAMHEHNTKVQQNVARCAGAKEKHPPIDVRDELKSLNSDLQYFTHGLEAIGMSRSNIESVLKFASQGPNYVGTLGEMVENERGHEMFMAN